MNRKVHSSVLLTRVLYSPAYLLTDLRISPAVPTNQVRPTDPNPNPTPTPNPNPHQVRPTDVALGQNKRSVNCIAIDDDDQTMFCGSQARYLVITPPSSEDAQTMFCGSQARSLVITPHLVRMRMIRRCSAAARHVT